MLIVNIIGGLGNQMFQYASIKALSLRRGLRMKIYAGEFEGYSLHAGFELLRLFELEDDMATPAKVRAWLGCCSSSFLQKVLAKLHVRACGGLVLEPHHEFWPGLESIRDDSFLRGYWQSPRYFEDQAVQIRKAFAFVPPLDYASQQIAEQMQTGESVSLHIRRGDYLKGWRNRRKFVACPIAYYKQAIEYLRQRFSGLVYYVFTDDLEWAEKNLHSLTPGIRLVTHNRGENSYRDMQLMSCAKHNIIANSTFSWWGAWLNDNAGKIVVAPKQWFANGRSTKDLIPGNWVKL